MMVMKWKNAQNNTLFQYLEKKEKLWKEKENRIEERSKSDDREKDRSRKIKKEIGEVRERQSYDVREDMVEGIKGWNI